MDKRRELLLDIGKLLLTVTAATILGKFFTKAGFQEANIVVIYILNVLLVARFTHGYYFGIASSIISLLSFNYFFSAPYYTLSVYDSSYLVTFVIMLITALITSALTTKEKLLTQEAMEKGNENQMLYQLANNLSDASDIESILKVTIESVGRLLRTDIGCIYIGKSGTIYFQQIEGELVRQKAENYDEIEKSLVRLKTQYRKSARAYEYPIRGQGRLLAVLKINGSLSEEELKGKSRLLHAIIENVSLALERIEIMTEQIQDRQKIEKERDRANLLRSISHDLRTPLSGIMGTSEMLMDMTDKQDRRYCLIQGIYQDADWLKSLVENVLNLTRLRDGEVLIQKEPEAIEEIIGCAVAHVEKAFPDREIDVQIPEEFHLVPMDARLMEQVITNLLDNAVKHTKPDEKIQVAVSYTRAEVIVTVRDEGEGIASCDAPNIFQMFYTSKTRSSDIKKGIGLGLAICETVIKAHGGTICGQNRQDHQDHQGAEFIFRLPFS
ncbi:DUF4118 domain-containing protein [Faecalicatena sp. AGMB00832]|uniref:DUF4118 domain-containing protein n=1 Tax=Faecalicatena faecalis TaxID=2726362 RepID=A0ABS6D2L6_9FIRM|nr:DUF4118 domain-containing protein [Faecalicatena faecalis]MBU3875837.1 DUF4118 domain-containing protein [Faecalicatena faecalis]